MLKGFKPKHKLISLVLLATFFGWLIYIIAIKETLELKRRIKYNSEQILLINDAESQLAKFAKDLELLTIRTSVADNEEVFRENLLGQVNIHCKEIGITLRDFSKVHSYNHEDYTIYTYNILTEGSYINLQKLLYLLETTDFKGKISSVNFIVNTNARTGRKSLQMRVFFQYVFKN